MEILLGLVLIPVLFYTYNGVFGKSPDWINTAIFYFTAACLRYNLTDWCTVRGVYFCTTADSPVP